MIFVDKEYSDYQYLVSASDNYFILTNQRTASGTWQEPETIDIIYQYINPSIYVIESTQSITNTRTFQKVDTTSDVENRSDFNNILTSYFIVLFFILFLLNGFTRFAKKGGIFFGN